MGAELSTIWYVDSPRPALALRGYPAPDARSGQAIARVLFDDDVTPLGQVPLAHVAAGTPDVLYVGVYPGVTVVCADFPATMLPSELPEHWRRAGSSGRTLFVASSVAGARAGFAEWRGEELRRSFSADAADIFEDLGVPQVWERPFWAGEFPMTYPLDVFPDPQMLPFHPQRFAEAANRAWLGFRYTAVQPDDAIDPARLLVHGFRAGAPVAPAPPQVPETRNPDPAPPADHGEQSPAPAKRSPSLLRWLGFKA